MVSRRRMRRWCGLRRGLRRAGAGVVVGGLGHAVGSGVEEDYEVVGFDGGESGVAGEEVSGLADGADDIYDVLV